MSSFFSLSRGDRIYIIALVVFAVVCFLPWSRQIELGGMALLGWLLSALMIFSPTIALLRLFRSRRSERKSGNLP